jgi:hypothetical protein
VFDSSWNEHSENGAWKFPMNDDRKTPRDSKYAIKVLVFRVIVGLLFLGGVAFFGFRRPRAEEIFQTLDTIFAYLGKLVGSL